MFDLSVPALTLSYLNNDSEIAAMAIAKKGALL